MVYETNDLTHHGIKGMKWGVRRTASQLGHKTSPKKKRTPSRLGMAIKEKYGHHKEVKANKKLLKKDISDMTDEEIMTAIRRKQIENQYEALHPRKQSLGKRFVKSVGSNVIAPAAINAGRSFAENALKKLGNNLLKDAVDPNSIEALEKEWKKLDLKKKIIDIKNPKSKEESADEVAKRLQNESRQKDIDSGLDDLRRKNAIAREQEEANRRSRQSQTSNSNSDNDSDSQSGNRSRDNDSTRSETSTDTSSARQYVSGLPILSSRANTTSNDKSTSRGEHYVAELINKNDNVIKRWIE